MWDTGLVATRSTARKGTARLSVDDWVACALEVLADEGVAGIKIGTLCKRLGVTKGSFYWHFEDIEAFLGAVAEHWAAGRDEAVASFVELESVEPSRRLRLMMLRFADRSQWPLERAVREWARTNPFVQERVARTDLVMAEKVKEAFVEIGFSEEDAVLRSQMMFCTGVGLMFTLPEGADMDLGVGERMMDVLTGTSLGG